MRRLLSYPKWSLAAATLLIAAAGVAVGSELGIMSSGPSPEATASPSPTGGPSSASDEKTAGTGAAGGTHDHVVISINRQDGLEHAKSGVGRALVNGDTADNDNSAYAFSSCTDCRTVAVAAQIVIIWSDPQVVTPDNLAIAINQGCVRCQTMAAAYQYVVTTNGIVHFTAEGESKIAAIRNRIRSLAASDLPFTELDARLDAEIDQLWAVVDEQVVTSGRTAKSRDPRNATDVSTESDTPDPEPLPSPDPEPTSSVSPAVSPSPSPKPSESVTVTASPSPTASAST